MLILNTSYLYFEYQTQTLSEIKSQKCIVHALSVLTYITNGIQDEFLKKAVRLS